MFSGDAGLGQRSDIAADVDPPQRNTILAIQQIIMLAELPVDRGGAGSFGSDTASHAPLIS